MLWIFLTISDVTIFQSVSLCYNFPQAENNSQFFNEEIEQKTNHFYGKYAQLNRTG